MLPCLAKERHFVSLGSPATVFASSMHFFYPAADLTFNFGLIVQLYLPDCRLCTSGFPLDKTTVKCKWSTVQNKRKVRRGRNLFLFENF